MHAQRTTHAACAALIGLLSGCSLTPEPRTVVKRVQYVCPQDPPARVCPMMPDRPGRPDPHNLIGYAIQLEQGWQCWQRRDGDWQRLRLDCETTH